MSTINIKGRTGQDDLRDNCWANLTIKVAGQTPKKFHKFTGANGLASNKDFKLSVEFPGMLDPSQIEYFDIEHVSHEQFPQTRDNWDLDRIEFGMKFGRYPITIAQYGSHRFSGSSATLTIYPEEE